MRVCRPCDPHVNATQSVASSIVGVPLTRPCAFAIREKLFECQQGGLAISTSMRGWRHAPWRVDGCTSISSTLLTNSSSLRTGATTVPGPTGSGGGSRSTSSSRSCSSRRRIESRPRRIGRRPRLGGRPGELGGRRARQGFPPGRPTLRRACANSWRWAVPPPRRLSGRTCE